MDDTATPPRSTRFITFALLLVTLGILANRSSAFSQKEGYSLLAALSLLTIVYIVSIFLWIFQGFFSAILGGTLIYLTPIRSIDSLELSMVHLSEIYFFSGSLLLFLLLLERNRPPLVKGYWLFSLVISAGIFTCLFVDMSFTVRMIESRPELANVTVIDRLRGGFCLLWLVGILLGISGVFRSNPGKSQPTRSSAIAFLVVTLAAPGIGFGVAQAWYPFQGEAFLSGQAWTTLLDELTNWEVRKQACLAIASWSWLPPIWVWPLLILGCWQLFHYAKKYRLEGSSVPVYFWFAVCLFALGMEFTQLAGERPTITGVILFCSLPVFGVVHLGQRMLDRMTLEPPSPDAPAIRPVSLHKDRSGSIAP